jgi:hypothetical protein
MNTLLLITIIYSLYEIIWNTFKIKKWGKINSIFYPLLRIIITIALLSVSFIIALVEVKEIEMNLIFPLMASILINRMIMFFQEVSFTQGDLKTFNTFIHDSRDDINDDELSKSIKDNKCLSCDSVLNNECSNYLIRFITASKKSPMFSTNNLELNLITDVFRINYGICIKCDITKQEKGRKQIITGIIALILIPLIIALIKIFGGNGSPNETLMIIVLVILTVSLIAGPLFIWAGIDNAINESKRLMDSVPAQYQGINNSYILTENQYKKLFEKKKLSTNGKLFVIENE